LAKSATAALDSSLAGWQAENKRDAQSVAQLLVTAETLSKEQGMDDQVFKDAAKMLIWWTTALQTSEATPQEGDTSDTSDLESLSERSSQASSQQLGCLLIGDVTMRHPITKTVIFDRLCVADLTTARGRAAYTLQNWARRHFNLNKLAGRANCAKTTATGAIVRLPAGKIIGLRSSASWGEQPAVLSELSFIQMLYGTFVPMSGVAVCTRKIEVINSYPVIFASSLIENLTYSCRHAVAQEQPGKTAPSDHGVRFKEDGLPEPESDELIWNLCKKVGMSVALLGDQYKPGGLWGQIELNETMVQLAVISGEDASKIELVRALLTKPDCLVVHRATDGWTITAQRQLIHLLHAFVDFNLECDAPDRPGGRTVLLCTSDLALSLALGERDLVLTLMTKSQAVLQTKEGSGIDDGLNMQCKAWGARPLVHSHV